MSPSPTTRPRLRVLIALLLFGVAGAGLFAWFHARAPEPPVLDLQGADPEVAAAIEKARAAVHAAPRSGPAWGKLAMVLFANGFVAESKVCFAQAKRYDPGEPRWPYYLGEILSYGAPEAAIVELKRAVDLDTREPAPRLRLAGLLLGQGQLDEAETHYRALLQREPANTWAHLGMGQVAVARGQHAESVAALEHAASRPETEKTARQVLGQVRHRLGNEAAAAEQARRASQLPDPGGWPEPWLDELWQHEIGQKQRLRRADDLVRQGQASAAMGLLRQITYRDPGCGEAWLKLGMALVKTDKPTETESALANAVRLLPDSADAHLHLGLVLFRKNEFAAAAASFRKAVALRPGYALAHYDLGHALERLGDQTAAAGAFRQALRCRPDFADAHRDLGALLIATGQPAQARQHLQQACELNPADPTASSLLEKAKHQGTP